MQAIDAASGVVCWNFSQLSDEDSDQVGAFPSAPVAYDDTVYIASGNDTLYALAINGS